MLLPGGGGWELDEDVAPAEAALLSAGISEAPRADAPPDGLSYKNVCNYDLTTTYKTIL